MIHSKNKVIYDDVVDNDTDKGTSKEESEGKYQTKESNKEDLELDKSELNERDQIENKVLFKRMKTPTKGNDDDKVDTDNDQDTND